MGTKGRLFTFGCSMTSYDYPTWADILGRSWSYFENWGKQGSGNHFIFNSIIECNRRNNLNSKDTVIIMWSSIARHDVYQFNHWIGNVNLFLHDKKNTTVNCPTGYEIQSYAFMQAVHEILDNRKVNYIPCTWTNYDLDGHPGDLYRDCIVRIRHISANLDKKVYPATYLEKGLEYWKTTYEIISGQDWPTLEEFLSGKFNTANEFIKKELQEFRDMMEKDYRWRQLTTVEIHPSPLDHLQMARKILPKIEISADTVKWIEDIDKKLNDGVKFSFNKHLPDRL
jgi:hypothetical protein